MTDENTPRRGRAALGNPASRFNRTDIHAVDGDWPGDGEPPAPLRTRIVVEDARSILSRNDSPDISFDRSVNVYQGCEHGCIYCYARPTHAWHNLSPGLDFETRIIAKRNAVSLLRETLARRGYQPDVLALGANTDPYQPAERQLRLTRGVLELLVECGHPVTITTKSALIERDLDLLVALAGRHLAHVWLSVTTLDAGLASRMEPRAATPERRLRTVQRLSEAGVPVGVMIAPVVPVLTDAELETLVGAAAAYGADAAQTLLLRLPREVGTLFEEWLTRHAPGQASHVLSRIRDLRQGALNDSRFGSRHRGEGVFAQMIAQRFALACRRHGLASVLPPLSCDAFVPPASCGQTRLF